MNSAKNKFAVGLCFFLCASTYARNCLDGLMQEKEESQHCVQQLIANINGRKSSTYEQNYNQGIDKYNKGLYLASNEYFQNAVASRPNAKSMFYLSSSMHQSMISKEVVRENCLGEQDIQWLELANLRQYYYMVILLQNSSKASDRISKSNLQVTINRFNCLDKISKKQCILINKDLGSCLVS